MLIPSLRLVFHGKMHRKVEKILDLFVNTKSSCMRLEREAVSPNKYLYLEKLIVFKFDQTCNKKFHNSLIPSLCLFYLILVVAEL